MQAYVGLSYFPPEEVKTVGLREIKLDVTKLRGQAGRFANIFLTRYVDPTWINVSCWNWYQLVIIQLRAITSG